MKTLRLISSLLVAISALACTSEPAGPGPGTKLAQETRIPSQEGAVDVQVQDDKLIIHFDHEPPAYSAGEVVYGTEGPGYLRRVTSVERNGDEVVLATEPATLGDAFEQVKVDQVVAVAPDQVTQQIVPTWRKQDVMIDGRRYLEEIRYDAPVSHPVARAQTTSFVWEFPRLDITLTDPQGNIALELAADDLRIEKQITLDVKVDLTAGTLNELRFVTEDDTTTTVDGLQISTSGSLAIADVSLPVFVAPAIAVVPVGPLVFTLGAEVDLGASVSLSGEAEVHASGETTFHTWRKSGVIWNGVYTFIDESNADVDGDLDSLAASATVTAKAEASVSGKLDFLLFGVVGPEIFAKVSPVIAELTFLVTSCGRGSVDGTLSASGSAGARFVFPFFQLPDTSVTFASFNRQYATFHRDFRF
jgi:hypothetical protein